MSSLDPTAVVVAAVSATPPTLTAIAVLVQNIRLGRRVRVVEGHTATAATELTPNHGSSTKDAINRLEAAIGRTQQTVDQTSEKVDRARCDIEGMRKDIGGLRDEIRTERKERMQLEDRVTVVERRGEP